MRRLGNTVALALLAFPSARVQAEERRLTYDEALNLASRRAPALAIARAREAIATNEVSVAGIYPNPTAYAGTSTQAARFSVGATVPLVILGQRGAAIEAGRAEQRTAAVETEVSLLESRASVAHAFVALWLAERTAKARQEALQIATRLEASVKARVEIGSSPELEALRVHAEWLRSDADAQASQALVDAASADLSRWIGGSDAPAIRVQGDPRVPEQVPLLPSLTKTIDTSAPVRREEANARAADARAQRERALLRPTLFLDVGADTHDPSLPATNYHAQLAVDLPLFSQRGPLVQRELQQGVLARSLLDATRNAKRADLQVAYQTFVAFSARTRTLTASVIPAVTHASEMTEASYALGSAPLVSVLDAERARLDALLALEEARALRANAWIDTQLATGAL